MATVNKSGDVAITKAMERICIVIKRYSTKLLNAISAAQVAGVITSDQALIASTFVSTASNICTIFKLISGY